MESGELRKVQGLGVPRWGYSESQDCWMVAEGEVRARPCGSESPACLHPGPRLQPHVRPYFPLFIMFQLDRPFCSSNPRGLFLPLDFVFASSPPASLLFAQVDAFTAASLHSCVSSEAPASGLPWPPHPLSHQGKHYLYCHLYVTHRYQEVCFLFPGLGCPPLSNDLICFSTSDSQGFSQSLTHWRNETHVY